MISLFKKKKSDFVMPEGLSKAERSKRDPCKSKT